VIETSILLHRVVASLDRAGDRILRSTLGLSHSRAVLLLVVERRGPLPQSALADELGCTQPAVTGLLREVTRDGHAEVRVDQANRRRRIVSLTPAGRSVVAAATTLLDQRFTELLAKAGTDGSALHAQLADIDRVLNPGEEHRY
jgi:DNA-binding MarR family transcriptional regulator